MQSFRLKRWNMRIALVAAYMLVLQGLLGAFAMGTAAASQLFDGFGNPLCITSADTGGAGSDGSRHSPLPDCCTVACSMFAPAGADDRASVSLANPLSAADPDLPLPYELPRRSLAPEHGPGSPRSPPSQT